MKSWFDNLKKSIRDAGFTQQQIADRLGVTQPTVSNWLRGHAVPSINKINELSKVLNMSVSEMLGESAIFLENESERDLIQAFRNLSERDRRAIERMIEGFKRDTDDHEDSE